MLIINLSSIQIYLFRSHVESSDVDRILQIFDNAQQVFILIIYIWCVLKKNSNKILDA